MSEKTIFKKIIDRELPAYIIYEDEKFLVFLNIYPDNPGHTLVIPKQEVRWVWNVTDYDEYFQLARKIVLAQQRVFGTDMIVMKVHGEQVPHAHIHLIPQVKKDGSEQEFDVIAKKIKAELDK